jgi:hypothetical protein
MFRTEGDELQVVFLEGLNGPGQLSSLDRSALWLSGRHAVNGFAAFNCFSRGILAALRWELG